MGLLVIDEGFWQAGLRGLDGKAKLTLDGLEPVRSSPACYDGRNKLHIANTADLVAVRGEAAFRDEESALLAIHDAGVDRIDALYVGVPRLWRSWVFAAGEQCRSLVRTRLLRARHGDSSGVRGAAWLWPAREAE
mgnify:CR=1 FL=1